jgi:hypothetical protein
LASVLLIATEKTSRTGGGGGSATDPLKAKKNQITRVRSQNWPPLPSFDQSAACVCEHSRNFFSSYPKYLMFVRDTTPIAILSLYCISAVTARSSSFSLFCLTQGCQFEIKITFVWAAFFFSALP